MFKFYLPTVCFTKTITKAPCYQTRTRPSRSNSLSPSSAIFITIVFFDPKPAEKYNSDDKFEKYLYFQASLSLFGSIIGAHFRVI
jgi:hypothetical protein